MRLLRLNAALLALLFSVIAEVLLFLVVWAFGHFSQFGTPLNFIAWFGYWFITCPTYYLIFLHLGHFADALCIPASVMHWWIFFLTGILFARYVARQNGSKQLKFIVYSLSVALTLSLGFLLHSYGWQNSIYRGEIVSLAETQGCEKAGKDFEAGKLRNLIISGECNEDKYSGTNDGPFEIWIVQCHPMLPWPCLYSTKKAVESYNSTMRRKYQWSLTHTNSIKLPSNP